METQNTTTPSSYRSHGPMPQRMKLDVPTIDAIAETYPEAVREPLRWLAGWCVDVCKGKTDILVERVHKAGFRKTKNYFYQVFTGRYFKIAEDGETPAGQITNFLQLVEKIRAAYVTAQRAGSIPFVPTGTYLKIENYIDTKRMPDTVCKFGVIIGPTGSQKSASFDHYCEKNNHGKCVRIESPSNGSISQFIYDLSNRYGATKSERKHNRLAIINEAVQNDRCIIIDNCQRMYRERMGADQPLFNFVQKLQDDTNCTIIFSVTPDSAKFLTDGFDKAYFEQFEGRAGGRDTFLELDDQTPAADIRAIALAFGFTPDTYKEASAMLGKLARSAGKIRILFDTLQAARRLADREKTKTLTLDHILSARPHLAKIEIEKA
jgi:DNA transposition AAA+ family ATPase